MKLKERVIQYATSIGVDLIGFTTAEPFQNLREILEEREKLGHLSGFEEKRIEYRIDPRKIMKNAESIIVVGISYYIGSEVIDDKEVPKFYGRMARTAWGRDYHHVVREKLEKIAMFIKENQHDFEYKVFVDTGPLVDREVAYRAGIGFYGMNSTLINETYGSWIFIGYMLTSIPFDPDGPLVNRACLGCHLCIDQCPMGAIEKPYGFNASKCISNILQKKEEIPEEIRPNIGERIYGCDVCQEVCPHNAGIRPSGQKDFIPLEPPHKIDLLKLLTITNQEFRNIYGKNASGWRGKKVLQRNAIIALANHGDESAIPHLIPLLKDPRPEIRKYAIWGIYTLNPQKARSFLMEMQNHENSEEIKSLIKSYIRRIENERSK